MENILPVFNNLIIFNQSSIILIELNNGIKSNFSSPCLIDQFKNNSKPDRLKFS